MADETLRSSGWPGLAALTAARWVDAQPEFARSHHLTGFGFPDGKFRFKPDWAALGPHTAGLPHLARPRRHHGRRRPVPPGGATAAAIPELDVHRDADIPQARKPPNTTPVRRRCRHPGHSRRQPRSRLGNTRGDGRTARRDHRGPTKRRRHRRRRLAQRRLERRHRHQRPDLRHPGRPRRRRRLPRTTAVWVEAA